eukprot:2662888-Alexandrium_andersonii.AAC.1
MSSCTRVRESDVLEVHNIVAQLATGHIDAAWLPPGVRSQAAMGGDEAESVFAALTVRLQALLAFHFFPPVALGNRAEAVAEKLHSLLWALALETDGLASLR